MTTLAWVTQTIEVDGIVSERGRSRVGDDNVFTRPIFQMLNDHPDPECVPCCCQYWGPCYEWSPGDPILRFTSNGLEVS